MRRSFNNVVTLQSSVCNIDFEQSLICSKIRAEELNEECNMSEPSRAYVIRVAIKLYQRFEFSSHIEAA